MEEPEVVAQLVGEDGFTTLFHEGKTDNLHISVISNKIILLVVFDERSSLGLVRLRVDQVASELGTIVKDVLNRPESEKAAAAAAAATPFAEITDDDIDALADHFVGELGDDAVARTLSPAARRALRRILEVHHD